MFEFLYNKFMKLKQSVIMLLILAGLLGTISIGLAANYNKPIEDVPEVVENVIPETFAKQIINSDKVPAEVLQVITDYMDDYFLSLYTLELQDTTKYFSDVKEGQISDSAIKLTVESRKMYDFDFTMSDAYYVLNITECINNNGKYTVSFLEDDSFSFKFLNGITSETYDVENEMVIEKVNEEYKISYYDKVQGYYMMFTDNRDIDQMEYLYNFYIERLTKTFEDENYKKSIVSTTPYVSDKVFNVKYDRVAASKYADTYYHNRNNNYYDFDDEGGNCQNFASQTLLAGGMVMDHDGNCQWYYNDHLDYVPSWVHVSSFAEYSKDNEGKGLVCDSYCSNIYYAEPGDLIQVGISSVSHTTIVSKIVDGHILLNSNSIDMKDFPLEAYTYPVRRLIKILGSNS